MPSSTLKSFLDSRGATYDSITHAPAISAQDVALLSHVEQRDFAKTLIVKIKGELTMVVVPADRKVVLADLRDLLGTGDVSFATEAEFRDRFPDCEVGAMPPFGNLYGLPVYVSRELADEPEIAFNAGTHREVIKMPYADFARMVRPIVADVGVME
ncbi:MAG TPA: YbaK/EbsC family protein [Opitutaceae bacterium]|nr:YbaK/EbsC family protein [Opitutaceae bacterium]